MSSSTSSSSVRSRRAPVWMVRAIRTHTAAPNPSTSRPGEIGRSLDGRPRSIPLDGAEPGVCSIATTSLATFTSAAVSFAPSSIAPSWAWASLGRIAAADVGGGERAVEVDRAASAPGQVEVDRTADRRSGGADEGGGQAGLAEAEAVQGEHGECGSSQHGGDPSCRRDGPVRGPPWAFDEGAARILCGPDGSATGWLANRLHTRVTTLRTIRRSAREGSRRDRTTTHLGTNRDRSAGQDSAKR